MSSPTSADPKEIVRDGYNAISYLYRSPSAPAPEHYKHWASSLIALLPSASSVLDLGCGCGIPLARDLAEAGFAVTGVDISDVQIARARELDLPHATFIQGDATSPELAKSFPVERFDAIIGLYMLIHLPLVEQSPLLYRMANWVKQGGYVMLTTGVNAWTGEQRGWLGSGDVRMWWCQAGVDDYRRWFREAGFDVVREEHVPEEGNDGHQFFLLRRT